jgi:hypothetical protein
VLDDGEIVERGTHNELLALRGRYFQLFEKQSHVFGSLFVNPGEQVTTEVARR